MASPAVSNAEPGPVLSERQLECLVWVARGKSSWEIARIVAISERTVNFHIGNAMKILGAVKRSQAVVLAAQHGLLDVDALPSEPPSTW